MITPVSNMLNLPVPFTRANYCQDKKSDIIQPGH